MLRREEVEAALRRLKKVIAEIRTENPERAAGAAPAWARQLNAAAALLRSCGGLEDELDELSVIAKGIQAEAEEGTPTFRTLARWAKLLDNTVQEIALAALGREEV